jgi:hypothetical protein
MAEMLRRADQARDELPALGTLQRWWLHTKTDDQIDPAILAIARFPNDEELGRPVFVLSNMSDDGTRSSVFDVGERLRAQIKPERMYQVRNLLADDPKRGVWPDPISGAELIEKGLFVELGPKETQVLELSRAR